MSLYPTLERKEEIMEQTEQKVYSILSEIESVKALNEIIPQLDLHDLGFLSSQCLVLRTAVESLAGEIGNTLNLIQENIDSKYNS